LVAVNAGGTIRDCYAKGDIITIDDGGTFDGNRVGGLVGSNWYGLVQNCYATGDVTGTYRVGGLVGGNDWATILNSFSTGSVASTTSYEGGLVGSNTENITNSYWNNHAGNPDDCYREGNDGCFAIADDVTWFYDELNGPMDVWDFCITPIWGVDTTYPCLIWEDNCEMSSHCCVDDDGDGVCNNEDECPDSKPGEQVDENGCDHFQFCKQFRLGIRCLKADFLDDEDARFPRDCTNGIILINGKPRPACVPFEYKFPYCKHKPGPCGKGWWQKMFNK
jgi:hypothetical protein